MIKAKSEYSFDSELVDEYIKEIQKALPGYDINVNNVNDFSTMIEEKNNCNNCRSIDCCKNSQKGYFTDYVNGEFKYSKCKFLKNSNNSLITNYYLAPRLLNAKLDDFDVNCESRTKIFKYITTFVNEIVKGNEVTGLYLHGDCSRGKTYTLAVIANLLAENGVESVICYFPDLVSQLRNDYYSDKNSYEETLDKIRNVHVLLIDDFGSENMTEWLRDEILGPMINYRMSMGLPIFISSNVDPKALKSHIAIDKNPDNILKAERIINRLTSMMITNSMDDSKKYIR